ncbi:MAG TPA: HDOD domain-containing protein [Halanaerobiales bacterium]|nr:HDOD domain-containing protein [Halanaerobiales bacterium]
MEESILARKPVLNLNQDVIAYEIIFKNSYDNKITDDNIDITAEAINNDVEFIEQTNLSNGKKIFMNFTRDLLKNEVVNFLAKDNLGIEISEDIDYDANLISNIVKLKDEGALIILNDLNPYKPNTTLIKYADILKLDFNKFKEKEHTLIINLLKNKYNKNLKFMAENINEHEQFDQAKECGYDYFQGIFFTKPEVMANRKIPGYKLNYLNFLKELNKPEIDFDKLEDIIKNDMSMTVSLLSTINSAYYGYNVSSIKQASTLLGINGLKKWSLIYLAEGLRNDKPDILFVNTLTRAKFVESAAEDFGVKEKSSELFTMGMLSMMDAFLNKPLEEIIDEISLKGDIKEALLRGEGIYGEILQLAIAFERVKWQEISIIEKTYGLNPKKLYSKYLAAVDFAYETMNMLIENA